MLAAPSLQPAMSFSIPAATSTNAQSTQAPRIPSPEYIASRVQSIANYKLRLEASQNEPRLRKLLGHIFVYDAIREHKQSQPPTYTSPPAQRRREQQLRRRRQMSESANASSALSSSRIEDDYAPQVSDNASDIQAYLATIPDTIPSSQAYDFSTFQEAIASQLATLSQVRLEAASRQLYHMTQDDDDADDFAVEEYASSDDDDADSDYDSYDGDSSDDWRNENEGGWAFDHPSNNVSHDEDDIGGDSDTDPESVNSAPPSPTGDFGDIHGPTDMAKDSKATSENTACYSGLTQVTGGCYFLPLRPVPQERRRRQSPCGS
jgi:hypothetical protein